MKNQNNFLVSNYDLQDEINKFIGKTNYVGIQLGKHWAHLTDVEKFFGKANYLGVQIGLRTQQLADPEKFFGKANYLGVQIGIRAQQLADPEKFVKKSKFVGDQLTISIYHVVDSNQPTLLVLLIPLVGLVLIRSEHERIEFHDIQRFVSVVFIVILLSSGIISPFYLSSFLLG